MRVDQFLPCLARHDAIGNHTLQLRTALRQAGIDSDVFYETVDPKLNGDARPYQTWLPTSDQAALIYHASTHGEMAAWLADRADEGLNLVVDYHNITPAEYFDRWEPEAAASMRLARAELAALAPSVGLGLADSSFNRSELDDLGYKATATAPLLVDLGPFLRLSGPRQSSPSATAAHPFAPPRASGARWLFVGRVAPNKCQHDVIAAFAVYRRLYDPTATLALVGGATSPRYLSALRRMVADLEVGAGVQFLGGLPFPRLLAEYTSADVFVCLSEHEGFCAPLLEAMHLGVPVVAYAAAAVPETVGSAGVLLGGKDPLEAALAVGGVLADPDLRRHLVEEGRHRAAELGLSASSKTFLATLTGWLAERG